jgi:type IV pilus assembly protein PilE
MDNIVKNSGYKPLKKGFTLVELMVTVLIVGILAAIAVPSYIKHTQTSKRLMAINEIFAIQVAETRYRSVNTSYANLDTIGYNASSSYYTFSVTDTSATTYTITATVIDESSQALDSHDGSACSPLTLNQNHAKTPAACWPE